MRRSSSTIRTVGAYRESLKLTTDLFNGGAAALADVAQAEAQLDNALTQAADIKLQRAQAEHAIAVIVGENPSLFSLPANALPLDRRAAADRCRAPLDPAGAPAGRGRGRAAGGRRECADRRRPRGLLSQADAQRHRRCRERAGPRICFPRPSLFWSLGPQVSAPIFEGGRLVAETARVKAVHQEQAADYRNTVLMAYQDVEDNLVALRRLQEESETDAAAVLATGIALKQAQDRYVAGIVTYLEVSTAETAALQAQVQATTIQARRMSASILLIKALGGGWDHASLARQ